MKVATTHRSCRTLTAMTVLLLVTGCRGETRLPALDLDLARGRNALEEGRTEWARYHFDRLLERRPEFTEAWRLAGEAWSSGPAQSSSRAAESFERFLQGNPNADEVRLRAARLWLLIGNSERCLQLLAPIENHPEAVVLRINIHLDDDIELAWRLVESLLENQPDHEAGPALAAMVLERRGRFDEALPMARRAVAASPLDASLHYQLARLLRRSGATPESRKALEVHQLITNLEASGSLREGTALEQLRILENLEDLLPAARDEIVIRRLRIRASLGDRAAGLQLLDALANSPSLESGRLAEALSLEGRATTLYRDVCTETKSETVAREGCYRWARRLLRQGDLEAAEGRLTLLLEQAPWMARSYRLQAEIAEQRGLDSVALDSYRRAVELAPWHEAARAGLVAALRRTHQDEEAREVAAGSPALSPDEGKERPPK